MKARQGSQGRSKESAVKRTVKTIAATEYQQKNNTPAWANVQRARQALDNPEDHALEVEVLADCWNVIDQQFNTDSLKDGTQYRLFSRDEIQRYDNPMAAMMACIERGMYPPPELLLGLWLCWTEYLDSNGTVALEDALIEKPVRKAGNYASRYQKRTDRQQIAWAMLKLEEKGLTQEQAAEELVNRKGLTIDPESVVRTARGDGMYKFVRGKRKIKRVVNPVKRE